MAGEPILIVDDTPVNLKLTRILLVNEGFTVSTAASAEEALELLRSYHPRLILADVQLPGIDGLEMTRRIKQNERTRDITVVALTAFALKSDEQRARQAGCDGYITKPIDTRTLGGRVRQLLNQRAETPAPPETERESIPDAQMLALRSRFLTESQEGARQLLLELEGACNSTEGARTVHQWIGTSGLLGYTAISQLAREVEVLLLERPVDTAQARESLTNLMMAFTTPREARDIPMPDAIMDSLAGRHAALVGLPAHETERLCVALGRARAHAQFFELTSSPGSAHLQSCDLVVTYVLPQSMTSAWLDPSSIAAARPTVFVGSRDHLLALDPAVQAMAAHFLMDSWLPDEALMRLSLALTRKRPLAYRPSSRPAGGGIHVLIADDDATVLAPVRAALQSIGVEVHQAMDGPHTLEIARRLKPRATVLDINSHGMDSYRVLSALRAEGQAMGIVVLTARQQERNIMRGFKLGADDYMVKPFSPLELVARLKRLIAR